MGDGADQISHDVAIESVAGPSGSRSQSGEPAKLQAFDESCLNLVALGVVLFISIRYADRAGSDRAENRDSRPGVIAVSRLACRTSEGRVANTTDSSRAWLVA